MDARSRCLERLLLAFEDLGNARTEGSDAGAAAALKVMAKALIDAVDTLPDPSQVPNLDRDEWFAHDARFAKKQKGTYREALAGIPIFQNARVAPPAIPANPVNIPAAAMGDKTLALHISANQIIHIYQRHSYAHFDFNVLKLRNTFWPAPMTVADIYIDIVAKARRLYQSLRAEHVETEPDELEDRQVDLQLPGVFTIGKIESDVNGAYDGNGKPQDFIVQIETIAPEGVDQYTKAQLTAIHLVVP